MARIHLKSSFFLRASSARWICLLVSLSLTGCASAIPRRDASKLEFRNDFDKLVSIQPLGAAKKKHKRKTGKNLIVRKFHSVSQAQRSTENQWAPMPSQWRVPLIFPALGWHPPLSLFWFIKGRGFQPRLPVESINDQTGLKKQKKIVRKMTRGKKKMEGRLPPIEDSEDMIGRRPKMDPFHVGEKITMDVTYFNVSAGELVMETLPFVDVNGQKAYHFRYEAKSSRLFSLFYSVDDVAETFLDYASLLPSTYKLHVRESKQLREVRAYWDFKKGEAHVWDKQITEAHGLRQKNEEWKLEPYAQNVFSAAYYVRIFQMYPGKKLSFYVADGGHNFLFTGQVLRREKLKTQAGVFDAVVLKPKLQLNGIFHPVGNVLLWFSDDPHHYLLRIESKIRIGRIICQISKLDPGH